MASEYLQCRLRIRMEEAFNAVRENTQSAICRRRQYYHAQKEELKPGQKVWLFTPRGDPKKGHKYACYWDGPWVIVELVTDVLARIKTAGDWSAKEVNVVVAIDRLQVYHEPTGQPGQDEIDKVLLKPEDVQCPDDEFCMEMDELGTTFFE